MKRSSSSRKRRKHHSNTHQLSKRQSKPPQKLNKFDKLLSAFCGLSEPVQVILVLGVLFLLAWILSHPDLLKEIIRALQVWSALR